MENGEEWIVGFYLINCITHLSFVGRFDPPLSVEVATALPDSTCSGPDSHFLIKPRALCPRLCLYAIFTAKIFHSSEVELDFIYLYIYIYNLIIIIIIMDTMGL